MKAAILENGRVSKGEFPDPTPRNGQALVRTHRCALCASDAHFIHSGAMIVERAKKEPNNVYSTVDLDRPLVMGHEFVGEILDYGPGSRKPLRTGTKVTSIPIMQMDGRLGMVGYTNECPGGFGQYMLLDEDFILELPDDLDNDLAALIEPLAIGIEHARVGEPVKGDIALVLGCGAIGLGVIAGLRLAGIGPIIAADLDPGRRAIAIRMGADMAVDPRETSPYLPFRELGNRAPNIVYECIGKSGILNQMIEGIVPEGRIVIGGFSLDPEPLYIPPAQMKKLKIHFAQGETPADMIAARDAIVSGEVDMRPWLGTPIGLSQVEDALLAMSDPATAVRIVVDPWQE